MSARTRRFGVLAIPQGHCERCTRRYAWIARGAILASLLWLALIALVAISVVDWFRHRQAPLTWLLSVLAARVVVALTVSRVHAVRLVGRSGRTVVLRFRRGDAARAFLDENGLRDEPLHASLSLALAGMASPAS